VVKGYTVAQESLFLIVSSVPAVKLQKELFNCAKKYGSVVDFKRLDDYPNDVQFTETYMVKYATLKEARFAKKMMDSKNFFGGSLHVFYAPELENIEDTLAKMQERRLGFKKYIANMKVSGNNSGAILSRYHPSDALSKTMDAGSSKEAAIIASLESSRSDEPVVDIHTNSLSIPNSSQANVIIPCGSMIVSESSNNARIPPTVVDDNFLEHIKKFPPPTSIKSYPSPSVNDVSIGKPALYSSKTVGSAYDSMSESFEVGIGNVSNESYKNQQGPFVKTTTVITKVAKKRKSSNMIKNLVKHPPSKVVKLDLDSPKTSRLIRNIPQKSPAKVLVTKGVKLI